MQSSFRTYIRFFSSLNSKHLELSSKIGDFADNSEYKIVSVDVVDLNNPPAAFILQSAPNPVGFPTQLSGNSCVVIQLFPARKNYSAQLAFSFASSAIAMRQRAENTGSTDWKNWAYFTI